MSEKNYFPDMMRAMQDINNGIRSIDEIDWKKEIIHMGDFWAYMPEKIPVILWMWGLLCIVESPQKRQEILKHLDDVRLYYSKDSDTQSDVFVSIEALSNINEKILSYNTNHFPYSVKNPWPEENNPLNELAHILSDDAITAEDLISIAEEIRLAEIRKQTKTILIPVLKAFFYNGAFINDQIVKYISYLYKADAYRRLILSGNIEYKTLPKVQPLDRKIRNKCFDIYIENRIQKIKEKMDKDPSRLLDPTELECYQKLLEEEKEYMLHAKNLEDSIYPNWEQVSKLANMYMEYLKYKIKDKMDINKSDTSLSTEDKPIIVQGDYIAGDKHVGAHIDNVQPGAIGAQTTKD